MYTIHAPMIFAATGGEVMHSDHSLTWGRSWYWSHVLAFWDITDFPF